MASSADGQITNAAEVESDSPETDLSNNTASATVEVLPEVVLSPVAASHVRLGDTFNVEVRAQGAIDLAGAQFSVEYDASALDFVSGEVSPEFCNCQVSPPNATSGRLTFAFACSVGHTSADLPLRSLEFRTADGALVGETQIGITDVSLADGSVPSVKIPGSVALATVTLYLGLCGDVNGDVDVVDVITAL